MRQKRNLEQDLTIISAHRSYRKKLEVSQHRFHEQYGQHSHNGIDDWQFALIERCETHKQLKERENFLATQA